MRWSLKTAPRCATDVLPPLCPTKRTGLVHFRRKSSMMLLISSVCALLARNGSVPDTPPARSDRLSTTAVINGCSERTETNRPYRRRPSPPKRVPAHLMTGRHSIVVVDHARRESHWWHPCYELPKVMPLSDLLRFGGYLNRNIHTRTFKAAAARRRGFSKVQIAHRVSSVEARR